MKLRTFLVFILLLLTLSLTTATVALTPQNGQTPAWILTQTTTLQQPTPKSITITWGSETQANTINTSTQAYPSVGCFPDGSFVVVWHSNHAGDWNVYAKLFDSKGKNKTGDIRVNTFWLNSQTYPSVDCFPDGSGFVVAWSGEGQGVEVSGVFARLFYSNGSGKTGDIQVNTYTTNTQKDPSVCCFPDGSGFVVAWDGEGQGDTSGVFAKLFYSNGTGKTGDILVNTITNQAQGYPSVGCFPDGSFVVAWQSYLQDSSADGIFAKLFYSNGTGKTGDIQVNTYFNQFQQTPSVGCFSDGSFVVAWQSDVQDTSDFGVYAKLFYSSGKNKTGDIQVNTYTTNAQYMPSVGCFPGGSFVVAWFGEGQGDTNGVYAKLFYSSGNNKTGDILMNTHTENGQSNPSVGCFSDGSGFVVAWQSYLQDSSGYGVFFRVGYLPAPLSVFLLLAILSFTLSGPMISMLLLLGGGLAAAVLVGVLALWRFRRRR